MVKILIYTDYNKPYILDSLDAPLVARHYWIFSGPMLDYTLAPITYLEETIGPSIEIMVEGFKFIVPASWNILVSDKETTLVDSIPISNCSLSNYHALMMSSYDMKIRMSEIIVTDLNPHYSCVHPMINKGTMMCHPVGPERRNDDVENILNVVIGPYDLYSKYLNNVSAGELVF